MKLGGPNIMKAVLFFVMPLAIFGWTSIAALAPFTLHLGLLFFLVAISLVFVKGENPTLQIVRTAVNAATVLCLVGGTGWFLSPFFFLLYLLPIYLGFLYVPMVAFSFLAALLIIFAGSAGEVELAFDIMTLLSLLLVIPLVVYLRRKYLILRQTTKDILILEEDKSGIKDMDTISRLLANRVTNLGVTIRQPLTFIKQAATLILQNDLDEKEQTKQITRIRTTAAEALEHVRQFEGDTSANIVLTNQKRVKQPS